LFLLKNDEALALIPPNQHQGFLVSDFLVVVVEEHEDVTGGEGVFLAYLS